MTKIKNTQFDKYIEWLEKNMNNYDFNSKLLYFEVIDNYHIGAYFKSRPEILFCVFYVNSIQQFINEKEFESEGG